MELIGAIVMDNISKYMSFVTAVECGSFTKAGEILNYSQSAVSRMVSDIEEEWGISLLERSKSGVKLTSDGMRILPYARSLCSEYKKLCAKAGELNNLQSGIIRIGVFSSVATHWLPNIIKKFREDYPDIDYELLLGDYAEIEEWVSDGRVDCGFLRMPVDPRLETVFMDSDEMFAVLPENHPLAKKERLLPSDLCGEPFMMLKKGSESEAERIFKDEKIPLRIKFTTWDDYAIMSMVESGMGVSVLPGLILKRTPYRIAVRGFEKPEYRKICFAVHSGGTPSAAVRKFAEYLKYR